MLARVRRTLLILASVLTAVSLCSPVAQAAPGAEAPRVAAIQVTVFGADLSSSTKLEVEGAATCGQPGGQGTVSVFASQVAEFSFGSGSTTFTCGTEPVDWHITVYGSPGWHSGWVNVNAVFSDGVGITSDSRGFAI